MKKQRTLLLGCLLGAMTTLMAQVGVNTETPTRELDVNGDLRVRELSNKSADTNYDRILVADTNGNVDYADVATISPPANDQTLTYDSSTGALSISGAGGNSVTLPTSGGNQDITKTGSQLSLTGSGVNVTLNDDNPNNEIQTLTYDSGTGALSISGAGGNSVTLSTGGGNQDITKTGSQLSLTGSGVNVTLNDDNPNNEIQQLSISGNQLTISGSNGNTVTLPSSGGSGVTLGNLQTVTPSSGINSASFIAPEDGFYNITVATNRSVSGSGGGNTQAVTFSVSGVTIRQFSETELSSVFGTDVGTAHLDIFLKAGETLNVATSLSNVNKVTVVYRSIN